MFISKIRVKDYKSFRDSGEVEFKSGINLIVGQNNTGKTTLLEALEINIGDIPHRSLKTPKNKVYSNQERNNSTLYISLNLLEDDLPKLSDIDNNSLFQIPFPEKLLEECKPKSQMEMLSQGVGKMAEINASLEKRKRKIIDDYISKFTEALKSKITINFIYSNHNPHHSSFNLGLINEKIGTKMNFIILNWKKDTSNFIQYPGQYTQQRENVNDFGWDELNKFREKIYRFSAERPNLGRCLVGFDKELKADASNLAEVLQNIKNDNPDVYDEFNKYVSEVIPSVKWVSSSKIEPPQSGMGSWNEVRVWSVDKKTRRTDLAFPLSSSGTGVGQVLAILYVAITSEEPRTIIIDEPNSFLHPGAAKKLIQILNKFSQHQYFISTHSPEILSAAKPSTITRLKYIDGETIDESINLKQSKELRETLFEIGIRFSDIFFAENILWVEGLTEAKTFPLLFENEKELYDITFLPLVNTGDLREKKQARKNAKLAFDIYRRLSGEHALTPPFVAVIFDKEEENEQEVKELERISDGKAKFIPRRMFENYLLNSEAIANVYNAELELAEDRKVTTKQIEKWISESRSNKQYLNPKFKNRKEIKEREWLENVDGANLLVDLFSHFSDKTVEYRKITHSVKLTQWLLKNKPEQLSELKDFLLEILSTENVS